MFITAREVNGTPHELGWFPPETVGEIKRQTSEKMCVPMEALRLVSCSSISSGSSLENDGSPLGEVWPSFGPGSNLMVSVQMPSDEELLECVDDIRTHEGAYDKLANLACQFEGKRIPPSNTSFLKRVVAVICQSLHKRETSHKLSRAWAIQALTRLLKHSITQLRICHHPSRDGSPQSQASDMLESTIQMILEEFQELSQTDFWLERQEAREALDQAEAMGLQELNPGLQEMCSGCKDQKEHWNNLKADRQIQARAQMGGA